MTDYIDEETIQEYIEEYKSIDVAIDILEYRKSTIDDILRNHHNFIIGKDRLLNVRG